MAEFQMTIDGKAVSAPETFGVIDPSQGKPFAKAPECSRAQLDAAMESAAQAFRHWRRDEARRRQALRDCAAALRARANDLGRVLTQEQGKPLAKGIGEIHGAAFWFDFTASLELPVEVVQDDGLGELDAQHPWCYVELREDAGDGVHERGVDEFAR